MTVDVQRFLVFVEPLGEHLGGGFISYAPELKGCIADGGTPEQALLAIYDAIACRLDAGNVPAERPDRAVQHA